MKTTERFDKAYKALHKAFMEGTLALGTCTACACGNIVAYSMGIKVTVEKSLEDYRTNGPAPNTYWVDVTANADLLTNWNPAKKTELDLIKDTGYNIKEFQLIESAFETNCHIKFYEYRFHSEQEILNDQFNGLMAVMDLLMELDNIGSTTEKESFKEHPKLILVEN